MKVSEIVVPPRPKEIDKREFEGMSLREYFFASEPYHQAVFAVNYMHSRLERVTGEGSNLR